MIVLLGYIVGFSLNAYLSIQAYKEKNLNGLAISVGCAGCCAHGVICSILHHI